MHVPDGVLFHLAAVEYGEPGLSTTGGTTMGGGGGGGGPRMEGGGSRRRGEVETASRGGDRSKGEKLVLRIMLVNLVRLFHFTLSLLDFFYLRIFVTYAARFCHSSVHDYWGICGFARWLMTCKEQHVYDKVTPIDRTGDFCGSLRDIPLWINKSLSLIGING